jgi:hypothetical protein
MFRRSLLALLVVVWLSAVAYGMAFVWSYNHRPGEASVAPVLWPADSRVPRASSYTLVMLAHPKCPCTRATLEELSKLMTHTQVTHTQGRLRSFVLFIKPLGLPQGWDRTDLWQSASSIPGVTVLDDSDGVEAKRFDAHVSGQVMLYDQAGKLVFQGGITESRGQIGDNAGRSAIETQVNRGVSERNRTLVFGCALFDAEECRMQDHDKPNR